MIRLLKRRQRPAPEPRPVHDAPPCVRCLEASGRFVEGVALIDPHRPELGRLCESHEMAQEFDIQERTGLHPAELWAIQHGEAVNTTKEINR